MKTPREILLELHRASEDRLDEIRRQALSQAFEKTAEKPSSGTLANFWREVIWRSRLAWIGMAALWIVLWMVNRQVDSTSATVVSARTRPTPEAIRAYEEQRRFMVELLQPAESAPAEPARPRPQPRSELQIRWRAC